LLEFWTILKTLQNEIQPYKGIIEKMKRIIVIIFFLLLVILGPFLIPVPELVGLKQPEELADSQSKFIRLNNINVHYKKFGSGKLTFVLLHGFGANLNSWHAVIEDLGKYGTVISFDRPGFGLTEKPLTWDGESPYSPDSQVLLLDSLIDNFSSGNVILVGNSAGGTIAMNYARKYPEKVTALILVDPAVYAGGGAPSWIQPILKTPQFRHIGPLISRSFFSQGIEFLKKAWYDPSNITDETINMYTKPLEAINWDKAFWEFTIASKESDLVDHIGELKMPILVITGEKDEIVPTEQSVRLAGELSNATLTVIPKAGHLPHEETPAQFMQAVQDFLPTIKINQK
jgi:pimeloyl-ACP methyl ester carboxylesterase